MRWAGVGQAFRLAPAHGAVWRSLVPMMVVAKNLGHSNTRMLEKHYGHLAPSYVVDAIRAGAPRYGIAEDAGVLPLRPRRR